MHVSGRGPFRARLFEQVGVAGIKTVKRRALVPGEKWRDQVVIETDVRSMAPERGTVLLAENEHRLCSEIGSGMFSAALPEILPIENSVILVGYQRTDDVHSLAARRQQQVFRRVSNVPDIIHLTLAR